MPVSVLAKNSLNKFVFLKHDYDTQKDLLLFQMHYSCWTDSIEAVC